MNLLDSCSLSIPSLRLIHFTRCRFPCLMISIVLRMVLAPWYRNMGKPESQVSKRFSIEVGVAFQFFRFLICDFIMWWWYYLGLPPCPVTVTTMIIIFLVGIPAKTFICHWNPGRGHNPRYYKPYCIPKVSMFLEGKPPTELRLQAEILT